MGRLRLFYANRQNLFLWRGLPDSGVSRQKTTRSGNIYLIAVTILTVIVLFAGSNAGQAHHDLKKLSLKELVNIEVTSVSKKVEKLTEATAAVYVITSEDIRRMGMTSIPEALRMVPGLQVAQISASEWSVTPRGFGGTFANKLLVLIDGRSVYTPLFSGVFWDVQDVLLEDIDQIEIVRGPGGTLWGANAVNGIINIITKNSADAQGIYLIAGIGTEEKGFTSFRQGGKIGAKSSYRVYAKYTNRDKLIFEDNLSANDAWEIKRGGFRFDSEKSEKSSFCLMGDVYNGKVNHTYELALLTEPWKMESRDAADVSGGNILGRWIYKFTPFSVMSFQAFYDRTERTDIWIIEKRNTFDIDLQHDQRISSRVNVLTGLGIRRTSDDFDSTLTQWLKPEEQTDNLYSAFIRANISIIRQRLNLAVGSKFEHNNYSGFEYQPSLRLLWLPHPRHTIWTAVVRAVRTPSRAERASHVILAVVPPFSSTNNSALPLSLSMIGNDNFTSENMLAYEVGYRVEGPANISLDLAGFYNVYDNLRSMDIGTPAPNDSPPTYLILPLTLSNLGNGKIYGFELVADMRITYRLAVKAWYAFTHTHIDFPAIGELRSFSSSEYAYPENQFHMRFISNPFSNIELDIGFRFVDNLSSMDIDSYYTADFRLGWTPYLGLELSLVGRNLFERRHAEFGTVLNSHLTEIERSVYASVAWRY